MSGTLVGGIGNVFLGDDGFGVAVVRRLAARPAAETIRIADFGIRSMDLAYALLESYDDVILVDAMPRGKPPGTLTVIEPSLDGAPALPAHGLAPGGVLTMVKQLGGARAKRLRIVGCEPAEVPAEGDVHVGLSAPVAAAVDRAVALIEELVRHE